MPPLAIYLTRPWGGLADTWQPHMALSLSLGLEAELCTDTWTQYRHTDAAWSYLGQNWGSKHSF